MEAEVARISMISMAAVPTDSSLASAVSMDMLFKGLVHQHQKRLYRFVLNKIGHSSDAEDLTQQAFVEAAKAYEFFRGNSELSTWLYGIAMNLVRNYLSRAPHRRHHFESDDALADLATEQPDPSEQLAQKQALQTLQQEVNSLPPDMRDILLLVGLDEISYEEASVMLAVPLGTVRSRLSRARSTLRQRLAAAGMPVNF